MSTFFWIKRSLAYWIRAIVLTVIYSWIRRHFFTIFQKFWNICFKISGKSWRKTCIKISTTVFKRRYTVLTICKNMILFCPSIEFFSYQLQQFSNLSNYIYIYSYMIILCKNIYLLTYMSRIGYIFVLPILDGPINLQIPKPIFG